ncbi:MAG: hypothetical protein AVDCRST_MAG74-734 [uncultured Pyrinomonadaceae bacterium]|uniref:Uncharacterized protein n=1 Tax=uncultured Pyrinomonadaceae bacterium TaxID=2283094 RepID=A0A6J4ND31_9BACT|nr:MAG: hypothetical protein AVDCRST_MAG74-734 [uncultured Pyrinomonadaceae bacterium]
MKKLFLLIALVFSTAICSNIYAQVTPPPGAGDKDLRDTDVKKRSVEMDRIERDAKKNGKSAVNPATAQAEDRLAAKYDEIKTDYERIQLSQDAVIKTYQSSGKIDYAQIGKSALEINRSATRLHSNLFPAPPIENADVKKEEKKDDEIKKETKPAKSVRDLIVDLDNAIGSFATSSMFQNLRTVDAQVSDKAKLDLEKIIELSALLDAKAQKSASGGQ